MGDYAGPNPANCGLLISLMFVSILMASISNYIMTLPSTNLLKASSTKGKYMKASNTVKVTKLVSSTAAGVLQSFNSLTISVLAGKLLP